MDKNRLNYDEQADYNGMNELPDNLNHACRNMKNLPVSPYFTSRVMKRVEKQIRQNFWKAFDIFPTPVVQVAGALCLILLLVFLVYPTHNTTAAVSPTELELAITGQAEIASIDTDNQALQFALNITAE